MACATFQEAGNESAGGRGEEDDNKFLQYQAQDPVKKIQQSSWFLFFPPSHAVSLQTHLEIQRAATVGFSFHSHFRHCMIRWQACLHSTMIWKSVPCEDSSCHILHEVMEVARETGLLWGCPKPGVGRRGVGELGEASPSHQKLYSCISVSGGSDGEADLSNTTVFLQEDLPHHARWG